MSLHIFQPEVAFDLGEVLKALHIPEDPESEEYDAVCDLLKEAGKSASPKVLWRESRVEKGKDALFIDGIPFRDPLILEKLSLQRVVYPYVMTCGTELDDWSKGFADPLESFIADGIKVHALGLAGSAFRQYMKEEIFGEHIFSSLAPGSLPSWPIQGQEPLFQLLGEVKEKIGVVLTPDFLMLPTKSGSGILFESEEEFHSCQRCPRLNCPNRRV